MPVPDEPTPLNLCPLASGSKGNAWFAEANGTALLVDAGVSLRQLTRRLDEVGRRVEEIDHLLITHEHRDHVHAVVQLLKKHRPTIWASRGTLRKLRGMIPDGASVRMLNGRAETAGAFTVHAAAVSHDAAEPLAIRLETAGSSLAVATDLGAWDERVLALTAGADLLVCEANHDPHMLATGPYPAMLKRRVGGLLGHLSNEQGARLAAESVRRGTARVVLGHLSDTNNSPSLALDVFGEAMVRAGGSPELDVASQDHPGPWVTVAPRSSGPLTRLDRS